MRVLVACEISGTVRDAFISRGHDAYSLDLLPTRVPGPHIQDNVLNHLEDGWDLMIAHPPCTFLANSGVRWLGGKGKIDMSRWGEMVEAARLFKTILEAPIKYKCLENPTMHQYARRIIGQNWTQRVQPWQFGHGETKAIHLWLVNLPKLKPTKIVEGRMSFVHKLPPSEERQMVRSLFYKGIAEAMVDQWGELPL